MLKYDKDTNAITMVAKDTGDFIVSIDNYLLDNGDVVYFTVNEVLENRIFSIKVIAKASDIIPDAFASSINFSIF